MKTVPSFSLCVFLFIVVFVAMDKLIPRSSCCFGLIDHRVGVLLIAAAYVFFSLIDAIVFPIIFNALALIGIIPGISKFT